MPGATGATSGATVVGLPEFRRALRAMGPQWPRKLREVHKKIADHGAMLSRTVAESMGGVQAAAEAAIKGKANQRQARIGVTPTAKIPFADIAFWGAKKRTGWYARPRYKDDPAVQHPEWVGNSWDVAVAGQGPYAINDALAAYKPQLLEEYLDMIDELAREAFPSS